MPLVVVSPCDEIKEEQPGHQPEKWFGYAAIVFLTLPTTSLFLHQLGVLSPLPFLEASYRQFEVGSFDLFGVKVFVIGTNTMTTDMHLGVVHSGFLSPCNSGADRVHVEARRVPKTRKRPKM